MQYNLTRGKCIFKCLPQFKIALNMNIFSSYWRGGGVAPAVAPWLYAPAISLTTTDEQQ